MRDTIENWIRRGFVDGYRRNGFAVSECSTWRAMIQRCDDLGNQRYGGRGIKVCARWRKSLISFLTDMGPKPSPRHSLDRVDNDRGYFPKNCRWATRVEQSRNRRGLRMITFRGATLCVAAWAEKIGINRSTVYSRLNSNWSVERALAVAA